MAAFDIPVIYGLALSNNLSDLPDKGNALRNLGLEPLDLSEVGGINEYIDTDGFQCISNLSEPIQKLLSRYNTDTLTHTSVLAEGQDKNNITSNITINGALASSAIRYFTLDSYNSSENKFIPVDISTSRASSWSGFGDTLSYGSNVKITEGSSLSAGMLQFNVSSEPKLFDNSEIATHTIKVNINGRDYSLFAMRDVPLVFNGVFRAYNIQVEASDTVTPVSSKIYLTDTGNESRLFRNLSYISRTATIAGSYLTTKPRTVELYCDPNKLFGLSIPALGLSDLPYTSLISLRRLTISGNYFTLIPDIAYFAPKLTYLDISNNDLHRSSDKTLNSFSEAFIKRLPPVSILYAGNTMRGGVEIIYPDSPDTPMSVIEKYLPLTQLFLGRGSGSSYLTGITPSISSNCTIYNISNNNFNLLPSRGLFRPTVDNKLTQLILNGNRELSLSPETSAAYLNTANYSANLVTLNIDSTLLPIPNLQNKTNLRDIYVGTSNRVYSLNSHLSTLNSEFSLMRDNQYKFEGCSSLETIRINWCPITGLLPLFNNSKIRSLFLYSTALSGAQKPPSVTSDHSLYIETFSQCKNTLTSLTFVNNKPTGYTGLDYFYQPLQDDVFDNFPVISEIQYSTSNTTGATPKFIRCNNLKFIRFLGNAFADLNYVSSDCRSSLESIDYSLNSLSGGQATKTVGEVEGILSLAQLFDGSNNFTRVFNINFDSNLFNGLIEIEKVPNLRTLRVANNRLKGDIPNFSNAPNLRVLDLSRNQLTGFTPHGFDNSINIKEINITGNPLTVSQIELIIDSLYIMYEINSKKNNKNVAIYLSSTTPYTITNNNTVEKVNYLTINGRFNFVGLLLSPTPT